MPPTNQTHLARDTRGAVYVEFLVVFFPVLSFFLGLVQLIFVHTVSIMLEHAAAKSVRAAIVVLGDDRKLYDDEDPGRAAPGSRRRTAIEAAAAYVMSPAGPGRLRVVMNDAYGPHAAVTVRVEYDYACRVPIGRQLVCGLDGQRTMAAEATLPNQGAEYVY